MGRIGCVVGVGLILSASLGSPAPAQGIFGKDADDLLSKGKSLFDSVTGSESKSGVAGLSNADIGRGLKEALRVGTERVVGLLGRQDGFYRRPDVHIPLPGTLGKVKDTLDRFGMSFLTEDLERRLNRAAEQAVPRTASLFRDAIAQMTWQDVQQIYRGPQDSATRFFQGKMTQPLMASMRPIVDGEMANVGAIRAYDRMIGEYKKLPFMPDAKADLTNYVLGKALDGVFLYLGREEAAIRKDPAKRTTELLKRVFGQG